MRYLQKYAGAYQMNYSLQFPGIMHRKESLLSRIVTPMGIPFRSNMNFGAAQDLSAPPAGKRLFPPRSREDIRC